jgi:hypothetical protein
LFKYETLARTDFIFRALKAAERTTIERDEGGNDTTGCDFSRIYYVLLSEPQLNL